MMFFCFLPAFELRLLEILGFLLLTQISAVLEKVDDKLNGRLEAVIGIIYYKGYFEKAIQVENYDRLPVEIEVINRCH